MDSQKNSPIIELLKDIQNWMIDNDYECGEEGCEIFNRITNILYDLQSGQPN